MKNFLTYDASRKHSLLSLLLFSAFVAMLVFAIAWLRRPYDFDVDSHWYIKIAEGHISEVIKPFSNRVLHPFAAALLQKLLHLSVDTSFLVVGTLSVVVFVASTMLMATSQISFAAAAILLASPFLLGLFEDYYLPDVLHAAILSLFILCLFLRRYFLSFVCLLLLAITRESTVLLALIVIALSIQRRQWSLALGTAIAAIIGLLIARHVASFGQPNIHGLNDLAYMVLKVPYNFLHNVLGIVLWADTLALQQPLAFPDSPIWMIHVPQYVPLGSIHSIGIYGFDPSSSGLTLIYLLSVFGVMPSVLARELCDSNFRKSLFSNAPFWLLVALFYGAASFLLGTVIGASIGRLIGYGWPCFFIAFPFILRQRHNANGKFMIRFWLSYLVAAWLPYLVGLKSGTSILIVLLILLVVHLYVLREANRSVPFERR